MDANDRNAWRNRRGVTVPGMPETERLEMAQREMHQLMQVGARSQEVITECKRAYSRRAALEAAEFAAQFEGD